MKYVLIRGAKDSGKSTTADSVSKQFKKTSVRSLLKGLDGELYLSEEDINKQIENGTYLIETANQILLFVAGAPTEQKITITVLITFLVSLNINISFALIMMRSHERLNDFDTRQELDELGFECIFEEHIYRINNDAFKETELWNNRISKITETIKTNYAL